MSKIYFSELVKAVIAGDELASEKLTLSAIEQGASAGDILTEGLIPGIRVIGEQFGKGDAYLPELIVSGNAMEAALKHLEPLFEKDSSATAGSFLIGTVKGDVHDIGKNIVTMMLKGNGWKVTDLGVDIAPEAFCREVADGQYHVLGLSALLTTTMPSLDLTIKALEEAGLRSSIRIMIGGAPVTPAYAAQIGADAFGEDAWDAVTKAEKLIKGGLA